ncbi:MAG: hypothetical protein ACI4RA_04695, partial [Kiritimatiellia bacterium]
TGGVCRCGTGNQPPGDDPVPPPPDPRIGGLSVEFSKAAVVFEEAYTNAPGDVVARRSTTTRLTVSASGGPHGGSFTLRTRGLDRLSTRGGTGPLSVPPGMTLGPGETYCVSFVCGAARHSEAEGDVRVEGTFTDAATGETESPGAETTAVRLEVVPEFLFPPHLPNRHTFGVCERVGFFHLPDGISDASWQASVNVFDQGTERNKKLFQYSLTPGEATLTFSYKGVSFPVQTRCIAPSSIVCSRTPTVLAYSVPAGHAGGVGMDMELTLCPSNVSFRNIRMKELATTDGVVSGYFRQNSFSNWWNHTEAQGANKVFPVGRYNDFFDTVAIGDCPPLPETGGWSEGSITWRIPTVWREPSTFSISRGFQLFTVETQRSTIDSAGTVGVEKYKRRVVRPPGGRPVLTEMQ